VLGFCITLNTTYIIQSYLSSLVLYGELLNSELRLQKHFRENVVAEDSQNDLSSEDEELDGPVETEKEEQKATLEQEVEAESPPPDSSPRRRGPKRRARKE